MKWLLLHTIVLWVLPFQDLETLRLAYKEAGQDDSKIEAFSELVKDITKESNPTLIGYKGAAIALQAKIQKTIQEKKKGFIEGVDYLEYAIQKEPNNIELRFIRLGIQENTPKLLKYKGNIDQDKRFLIKQYPHISSKNLKGHIKDYIKQSKVFTDEEKNSI